MKWKTLRSNIVNLGKFPIVYFWRSSIVPVGESSGTVCGQAADTVSQPAHWVDQPGLWELRLHVSWVGNWSYITFHLDACSLMVILICGSPGVQENKWYDPILTFRSSVQLCLCRRSTPVQDERTTAQNSVVRKYALEKQQPLPQCMQFPR